MTEMSFKGSVDHLWRLFQASLGKWGQIVIEVAVRVLHRSVARPNLV